MKTEVSSFKIASVMIRYGGSFVKHLGEALLCADSENRERIKNGFRNYWEQYSEMALKLDEKGNEE